ncbi:hypothetical protein RQP46_006106 [Phenoliferia psychrophenolica]
MTNAHDLSPGDKVSWKWGAGQPSGKVEEVVDGDASITTNRGNEVSRHGDEENPAVKIKADSGNSAIKKASELIGIDTGDGSESKSKESPKKPSSTAAAKEASPPPADKASPTPVQTPPPAEVENLPEEEYPSNEIVKESDDVEAAKPDAGSADSKKDADSAESKKDTKPTSQDSKSPKKLAGAAKKAAETKAKSGATKKKPAADSAKPAATSTKRKAADADATEDLPAKRTRRATQKKDEGSGDRVDYAEEESGGEEEEAVVEDDEEFDPEQAAV